MNRGFTLIELLVVIAIIAIMLAILMPTMTTANDRARVTECRAHFTAIAIALDQFRRDRGANPPNLRALYDEEYITDDSMLLCTKTGAEYYYDADATAKDALMVACCDPKTPVGKRPHSQRRSLVALQVGGKIVEVGR